MDTAIDITGQFPTKLHLYEWVPDSTSGIGVTDITTHIYADDRHEIFNDIDKHNVWEDFAAWLDRVVSE